MGNDQASSGQENVFVPVYETRRIFIAEGAEFHRSDFIARGNGHLATIDWLADQFDDFEKHSDTEGEYTSEDQKVHYTIEMVDSKDAFQRALQTENVHVIYSGHSRYGRGACFGQYSGAVDQEGEHWENGAFSTEVLVDYFIQDEGLFRLGYSYVPVPLGDVRKHKYHFAPLAVEHGAPAYSERHPHARRRLLRIQLPDDVKQYLIPEYESQSGYYFGVRRGGHGHGPELHVLLHAGWDDTQTMPYDLGTTELKCKVFCHYGCSSSTHFWPIVRRTRYKGWVRPSPPTDRYAYFTKRPANAYTWLYWLFYLFTYPEQNNYEPWWDSLEFAKRNANRLLRTEGWRFQIY